MTKAEIVRPDAANPRREDRRQGGVFGRGDAGSSRPDRRDRRQLSGVPPRRCRRGAGHRRRNRQIGGRGRDSAIAVGGVPWRSRTSSRPPTCPRPAGPRSSRVGVAVRRDADREDPRRRHPDPRQDQHGRVRHGQLDGELRVRPDPATRGTPSVCPAGREAAAPPRSPRSRRRWPSDPIPAARSASPPP